MKVVMIGRCRDCPYSAPDAYRNIRWCEITDKKIRAKLKFPKWCPLEDLKESK